LSTPRLSNMNDIQRQRCSKCDYLNTDIPISKKKPSCKGSDNVLECDVYMSTERLETRIKYIKGEIGPLFCCGRDGYIDTYKQMGDYEGTQK
jgi:hypothetical protein